MIAEHIHISMGGDDHPEGREEGGAGRQPIATLETLMFTQTMLPMKNTTFTPLAIKTEATRLKQYFNELAHAIITVHEPDLDRPPEPEFYAAMMGYYDALSRSLRSQGEMIEAFERVEPEFRPGTIQNNFVLAEDHKHLARQLSDEA